MFKEFAVIEREAHLKGIPVIMWSYPRGKSVDENNPDTIAYAARVALELGADMVKLKYTGDVKSFSWVVKSAGRTKVVVSGGVKKDKSKFLDEVQSVMHAGAAGIAVGRNVWQSEDPMGVTAELKNIVYTS